MGGGVAASLKGAVGGLAHVGGGLFGAAGLFGKQSRAARVFGALCGDAEVDGFRRAGCQHRHFSCGQRRFEPGFQRLDATEGVADPR